MEPMAVFERLKTIAMEINVVIHTMMEYMSVYSREYMLLGLLIWSSVSFFLASHKCRRFDASRLLCGL
jgi:hypothetical protein